MRRVPDEELLQRLREKATQLGRTPTVLEIKADPLMPSYPSYYRRWGGHLNACEAAGLDISQLQVRKGTYAGPLDTHLRRTYGITEEDYWRLYHAQGGVCAICLRADGGRNGHGSMRLSVDHCHETGEVRGLLCASCNHGLGRFSDNPSVLSAAASYLLRQTQNT